MKQQPALSPNILPLFSELTKLILGGLTSCSFMYDDKLLSKVTRPETFGLTIPNCPATQRHGATSFCEPFPYSPRLVSWRPLGVFE